MVHVPGPEESARPPGDTLLVVEDDLDLREALCETLTAEGVSCVQAHDGWDALELLRGGLAPAAILLDLRMPEMDGIQFLRKRLTERPEIGQIPVLVLTGDRHGDEAAQLGAAAVIVKPTKVETLLDALRPFLARLADPSPPQPDG